MKQFKFKGVQILQLVLVSTAALLFSCNKDITVPEKAVVTTTPPVTVNATMTAFIEGDSFISNQGGAVLNDSAIIITGVDPSGNRIQLVVKGATEPGVFVISAKSGHNALYKIGASEPYVADSAGSGGQIRITGMDTTNRIISGTFSFKGTRANNTAKVITGGDFRMNYDVEITPDINENDTVYSTNPNISLNKMSAIVVSGVVTDTVDFVNVTSFMYLGNLHLTGYNSDAERITIAISPTATPGTIGLEGNFGPNSAYYMSPNPNSLLYAAVKNLSDITVTSNNVGMRRIQGTFSFEARITGGTGMKQINNGKVDIYY